MQGFFSRSANSKPGYVRGRHFTEYVPKVKELRRDGRISEAEGLLAELIDATEAEARAENCGVAPWYYQQLAVSYAKRGEYDLEIEVLERYAAQPHAPGVMPGRLLQRLAKKRATRERR